MLMEPSFSFFLCFFPNFDFPLLSDICLLMTSASSRLASVCQLAWELALALPLAAAYLLCRAGCWGRRPAAGRWASPFLLPSPRLLPHSRRARCPWCSANQSSPGLHICSGHTDTQTSRKQFVLRQKSPPSAKGKSVHVCVWVFHPRPISRK